MYFKRKIDDFLLNWKEDISHKPLIIKGARQILKTVNQRTVSHQRIRIPAAGISKQSLIQSRKRLHRWIPVRMDIRKLPGRVEPEV